MSRNRIFGAIGVAWGGAMVVRRFTKDDVTTSGAYAAGQDAAFIFGIIMAVVGLYYLLRG